VIVVDDHTLLAVLVGQAGGTEPTILDEGVFTTASWYYRLARAVRDPQFIGSLSRQVSALPPDIRRTVLGSLEELPPEIGVLSARRTVPVMAALSSIGRFNHLQAEAIASALVLTARLRVIVASEALQEACATLHLDLMIAPI
jgi:hypothetical protein